MNTLETIIDEIKQHGRSYPEHGAGCSCMDKYIATLRELIEEKEPNSKARENIERVLMHAALHP